MISNTVGVVGLGKLGLMMALVLAKHGGYHVTGYDPSALPNDILSGKTSAPVPAEEGITELLEDPDIDLASTPGGVVRAVDDVVFVVVPTPHPPEYDGTRPMAADAADDFEYGYLVQAVRDIVRAASEQAKRITVVIVSTVLPGTINREIRPLLNEWTTVVYSPSLIALGSVRADLLDPEFVILGADAHAHTLPAMRIYSRLHDRPFQIMSIASAELTKMAYNTFTSMKIVFANTMLELADKTGADADAVTGALAYATRNLASGAYLRGGIGGGGYCHPRDVVAMQYLSRRLGVAGDLFGFLRQAREDQSSWLADLIEYWSGLTGLSIVMFGTAYRPGSSLTGGSASLLLVNQLRDRGLMVETWDPVVSGGRSIAVEANSIAAHRRIYVIATDHYDFRGVAFAPGSVVIDPHGHIPDATGVTLVRPGRRK